METEQDIRNLPIEPENFYHIYNRGVNSRRIFNQSKNYSFFLDKVAENLLEVCDIYAYALLPSHFHFLVKIKPEDALKSLVKVQNLDKADEEKGLHAGRNIFSKRFSQIFNSYSQAYNKMYGRHGALIESPFKRKKINDESYLKKVIIYIHQNPELHSYVDDFRSYKLSSYNAILSKSKTRVMRAEVLDLFENRENFIHAHNIEQIINDFE